MELLIAAAVVLVLLFILGVGTDILIAGILCLLEIILLLMTVFFMISLCLVLTAKPFKAEFLRIEKTRGLGCHAIYRIGHMEYGNLFPMDAFMERHLQNHQLSTVRLWKSGDHAFTFDRYSMIVAALGLLISAVSALWLGKFVIQLLVL